MFIGIAGFLLPHAVSGSCVKYRFADKRKTLALAKTRQRRDKAHELLADGIDFSAAKKDANAEKSDLMSVNTFATVALE